MKNKLLNFFYSEERNQTADLLKGFAVLFMIQVHITENFLLLKLHQETFGKISFFLGGTPAAPVFMIVMGYFLSIKKNLLYYVERGTVLFLGGILLNIGLNFYYIILYFQNQIIEENILKYVFGVDILPFAGLSLIIIGLLKEIIKEKFYFYTIIGLLIAFVSKYFPNLPDNSSLWLKLVNSFIYGCTDWSYFPLFPWLFYPLMGFSFKLFSEKFQINFKFQAVIISLIILVLLFSQSYEQVVVVEDYYHHGLLLAFWNLAFIVLWYFLIEKIEFYFSKNPILVYIKWLGKNVTIIYVFQWLIIGNLTEILFDSQNEIQFFFWFIFVLFSSSILTYYYESNKMKNLSAQTND